MSGDPAFIYPITGVKTGGICERKEIDEFMKNPYWATLLTRAMQILQARPKEHTLSYFQLAGIHGLPFDQTWPVKGGPEAHNVPNQTGRGFYCYHGGPLFMTWHRPYVALLEQCLHDITMQLIDPNDPEYILSNVTDPVERNKWRQAAETFRLPYWDFALRRSNNQLGGKNYCSLPDVAISDIGISQIKPPKGVSLPNPGSSPYFAFSFAALGGSGLPDTDGLPVSIQGRTVKHAPAPSPGTIDAWINGESNIDSLKTYFRSQTLSWRANLVDMLLNNPTYNGFTYGGGVTRAPNLNNVHGSVHINTGGYPNVIGNKLGNMTSVPSAGFDPIFFFWHSMVDRLGALWQAGHPGAWMDSVSNNVDLLPFRTTAAQVRYWKSAGARDVTALGYTYPELAKISDLDSLQEVVDELYVDQARGGSRGGFASDAPNIILTAQYETNEVGPFDLDIHYGKGHLLGSIVNFVTPQSADCGNCKKNKEEHHTVTSTILLTQNLQELYEEGKLESLDNLEQALSGKISWTCRSLALGEEGREIPESEFKSLRIVVSKRADAAGDGSRGGFVDSPPVPLKGITDGKPFGLRKGEEFKFDTE